MKSVISILALNMPWRSSDSLVFLTQISELKMADSNPSNSKVFLEVTLLTNMIKWGTPNLAKKKVDECIHLFVIYNCDVTVEMVLIVILSLPIFIKFRVAIIFQ